MTAAHTRRRKIRAAGITALAGIVLIVAAAVALHAQQRTFDFFIFALDKEGKPILELKDTDLTMKEADGEGHIVNVRRYGWPLKLTVLLDNGAKTTNMLVHVRSGLKKLFDGLPPDVPVSLVTTAPAPRFLLREEKDPVKIQNAISKIVPEPEDGAYGRFADSLVEYAGRLDDEFRKLGPEQVPPYLPVLLVISTTNQDGSIVRREDNIKMITSLIQYRVWTNFVMITPSNPAAVNADDLSSEPNVEADQAQIGELANAVRDATRGQYFPLGGTGVSGLSSRVLPEFAQSVAMRYIKQMCQHIVTVERAEMATGPVRDLAIALKIEGAKFQLSPNGNMP
jgi:hypothetical protein